MTYISASAAASACFEAASDIAGRSAAIGRAAQLLLPHLESGRRIDAPLLRVAMDAAFGGTDASGAWAWKTGYDACEAATVLFLRKFAPAMRARAASPAAMLPMLAKISSLLPTHTRRSEESETFQQFSTPIALGFVASLAAAITPADVVLEPSAGTGLLAILAELAGGSLVLNELAETRAGLLSLLFPGIAVTSFDAAHIDDHLDTAIVPSVVLMNPPFSAVANVDRRMADAALRHISSALARLAEGGRLVAITGASCRARQSRMAGRLHRLQERGRVVFSAAIDGAVYAKHGTTIDTRLTVIDKAPAEDPTVFPLSSGHGAGRRDVARLGDAAGATSVCRSDRLSPLCDPASGHSRNGAGLRACARPPPQLRRCEPEATELAYETLAWTQPSTAASPKPSMNSTAYSRSVFPAPKPIPPCSCNQRRWRRSRRPCRPIGRICPRMSSRTACCRTPSSKCVIYAGEAHAGHLAGIMDGRRDVRFRLGRARGRRERRPLPPWLVSRRRHRRRQGPSGRRYPARQLAARAAAAPSGSRKSDKLIEDAQRDWSALGQERLLVTPLSRFRQGTPIRLAQGILFTTYATLRSDARDEKVSRVRQIVDWLGRDFDGVIVFDEATRCRMPPAARASAATQARLAAGPRGPAPAACLAERAHPLCLGDRRHHGPQSRLCAAARPLGRRGFPVRHPRASSSRRSRPAASRRWRCSRATSRRSASMRPARCPIEGVEYELVEHTLTARADPHL